jgi:hypothetical protein
MDEIERALIETEDWAVEHFVDDPPHTTRRRNNAWAICQALRDYRRRETMRALDSAKGGAA